MKVFPEENWDTYSYSIESKRVFVSFPVDALNADRSALVHCGRVIASIKAPNANGGPTGDEAKKLWAMEDLLCQSLQSGGVLCLMVGRLTLSGTRVLVFQLADWDQFEEVVNAWIRLYPSYSINLSKAVGWDFFVQYIAPSEEDWQLIMDEKTIENLVKAGSTLGKEHAIEFVFRGTQEALSKIDSRLLSALGYTRVSLEENTLVISKLVPLDIGSIYRESRSHLALAKEFGCEFDGWGALVVS